MSVLLVPLFFYSVASYIIYRAMVDIKFSYTCNYSLR